MATTGKPAGRGGAAPSQAQQQARAAYEARQQARQQPQQQRPQPAQQRDDQGAGQQPGRGGEEYDDQGAGQQLDRGGEHARQLDLGPFGPFVQQLVHAICEALCEWLQCEPHELQAAVKARAGSAEDDS